MTIYTSQRCSVSRILNFKGKLGAATSIPNFFDDHYKLNEKYFHSGRIGTKENKHVFSQIVIEIEIQ